jgi:uncharacterized membrane protein
MSLMLTRCLAILVFLSALVPAMAQQTTENPLAPPPASPASQTPPPKPPDMVCWGSGPNWSIQFVSWGARYLGINQPDQDFLGGFFWVPEDKVWAWHRTDGLAPTSGFGLSAIIKKASCTDPVRKETFSYSGQVNLPTGDMVNGCCRKLKPGEAPVGPHGLPSNNTPPQ